MEEFQILNIWPGDNDLTDYFHLQPEIEVFFTFMHTNLQYAAQPAATLILTGSRSGDVHESRGSPWSLPLH